MKQFILSLIICVCGLCPAHANNVTQIGNVFKVEKVSDSITPYFYEIDGVNYPIYRSSNGSFYIKRISKKTGKEYKTYLPKEVQERLRKLVEKYSNMKKN